MPKHNPRTALKVLEFGKKYIRTIGGVVSAATGIPENLCCFHISMVGSILAKEEGFDDVKLRSCLLVINDDYSHPLVVGHCLLQVGEGVNVDLAYRGPETYGAPEGTSHEYVTGPDCLSQFELPSNVKANLQLGPSKAVEWWQELGEQDRSNLTLAVKHAANGGNVVFA